MPRRHPRPPVAPNTQRADRAPDPATLAPQPPAAPLTPAERAEARYHRRTKRAQEQQTALLARIHAAQFQVDASQALAEARILLLLSLTTETCRCPACGATAPRLTPAEMEARTSEEAVRLMDRAFREATTRRDIERLAHHRDARAQRPERAGRPSPTTATISRPLFSRRPPPRMLRPGAPDGGSPIASGGAASPQLVDAIARQA